MHELYFVERVLEHKLEFKPYSLRGYIQYYKPTEEDELKIKGIGLVFSIRTIEKIPENGSLVFNKD